MASCMGSRDSMRPSMKVPPKRKGNESLLRLGNESSNSLNESPSEKEGKCAFKGSVGRNLIPLNESPSEKEGKSGTAKTHACKHGALNESPSEKEGKSQ